MALTSKMSEKQPKSINAKQESSSRDTNSHSFKRSLISCHLPTQYFSPTDPKFSFSHSPEPTSTMNTTLN
jgi:hypothetical protein